MRKSFLLLMVFSIFLTPLLRADNAVSEKGPKILNLADCVSTALTNNPTLKKWKNSIIADQYKIKKTLSQFYPVIKLSGGFSRSYSDPAPEASNRYSLSLNLNQLLFNGLGRYYNYKIAQKEKDITEENFNSSVLDIIYNVKQTYYKILLYTKQLDILENTIERRKKDYSIIKLKYEAGKESLVSVLEMEADVRSSEYSRLEARENLDLAKKELLLFMGQTNAIDYSVSEISNTFPMLEAAPVVHNALSVSPQLKISHTQLNIEEYNFKSAGSEYLPEINLTGGYGLQDEKFFPENKNWDIGLSISIPIFSGFSTVHSRNEIRSRISAQKEDIKQQQNDIKMNILQLLSKYSLLKEKQKVTALQYKAVYENYKLVKLQYQQGQIDYMWLKQKENDLADQEQQAENIIYDLRSTLAELEKYMTDY